MVFRVPNTKTKAKKSFSLPKPSENLDPSKTSREALPGDYCEIGRVICKQRKYLAKLGLLKPIFLIVFCLLFFKCMFVCLKGFVCLFLVIYLLLF